MEALTGSAWKVALAVGGAAVVGYAFVPGGTDRNLIYLVIGLSAPVLVGVGVRVHRPARRLPWMFLAISCLLAVVGDTIENVGYGMVLHRSLPLPSLADVFYLASYPVLYVGVMRVINRTDEPGSRDNYADSAIVALAALALSWHFVMAPTVDSAGVSSFGKVVDLAYPIADLGVLFIVIRALVFGGGRLACHRILTGSLLAAFVSDSVYDLLVLHGSYHSGSPIDAGWLLNYLLIGVAALHPSMADPVPPVPLPETRRRVPVLALAGTAAPGILLVCSAAGANVDVTTIAATSIVVFGLITLRLSWLFERVRAQTRRARADAAALAQALDERRGLERNLRHQAYHDALTGLPNRLLLHEEVAAALTRAAFDGGQVALCLCDLDGFKTVNDGLGHHCGDELLQVVANRLRKAVRSTDFVARLGGDEFAVLLRLAPSTYIADQIVEALNEPVTVGGEEVGISVSVGITFATPGANVARLLREADTAMYEAKRRGKGRWESFTRSMQREAVERLEIVNGFRGSLERHEFFLRYQPQFDLADGRLEGFEALVRWSHPTKGELSPDRFIPLAEATGFIVDLGRWVLEEACTKAASWFAAGDGLVMSVNLSGRQLQGTGMGDDVRTALALSGLTPGQLVLEVTETSLVADSEESTALLEELRSTGVRLAIDDFGTGYSSLAYLRRLPLGVLKIDKSFVDALDEPGQEGSALVATILGFAQILGLHTVAEGVEHEDQRRMLADLGCTSGQGFLFAGPLDEDDAAAVVVAATATRPAAAIREGSL